MWQEVAFCGKNGQNVAAKMWHRVAHAAKDLFFDTVISDSKPFSRSLITLIKIEMNALKQIQKKGYASPLISLGVKEIYGYGIAFYKNRVAVISKKIV